MNWSIFEFIDILHCDISFLAHILFLTKLIFEWVLLRCLVLNKWMLIHWYRAAIINLRLDSLLKLLCLFIIIEIVIYFFLAHTYTLIVFEIYETDIHSDLLEWTEKIGQSIIIQYDLVEIQKSNFFKSCQCLSFLIRKNLLKSFTYLALNSYWDIFFYKVFNHCEMVCMILSFEIHFYHLLLYSSFLLDECAIVCFVSY